MLKNYVMQLHIYSSTYLPKIIVTDCLMYFQLKEEGIDILFCSSLRSHYETETFVKTDLYNSGITFASAVPSV